MDPVNDDQDPNLDGDEGQQDEGGDQSGADGGDKGSQEPVAKVKIGDVEYTTDQLAQMVDKGKKYDDLLPDYTQKSQRLSEIEKAGKPGETGDQSQKKYYLDPNWKPKDYAELSQAIQFAEERGMTRALEKLNEDKVKMDEARTQVDNFVAEAKKADPDFVEKDFFSFATRHKFPVNSINDLQAVLSAYKESTKALELGEQRGRTNRNNRTDKVNQGSGKGGSQIDLTDIRTSGGDTSDKAMEALARIKH